VERGDHRGVCLEGGSVEVADQGHCLLRARRKRPRRRRAAEQRYELAPYRRTAQKFGFTGTWPPHALVILFDLAFPRQRCKSPREQRFAAVVSDGDHLLQPEPLVLAAR